MAKRTRERQPRALEQFKLGRVLAADGNLERAIECYVAAVTHDPDFPEALVNLGILYGQMGPSQAAEALRCLERAVDLSPASARAHYNLGVALSRGRHDHDRAIGEFEATIAIDSTHRNALYALAVLWNRRGNPVRASAYHRRYQAAMGSPVAAPRGPAMSARRRDPRKARPPREKVSETERAGPRLVVRFVR